MRAWTVALAVFFAGCTELPFETCPVGSLAESDYCGDDGVSCERLEDLSQGCIGSHTEQACVQDGETFVKVGGDDAADLYFGQDGALVGVNRQGEGETDECPDAWFGLDLSGCAAQGDPVTVSCESQGE
jgi:hypothetical protein